MVDYTNLETQIQTVVYNIITSDTNITNITSNIMAGIPTKLRKDTGYPHILIHYPEVTFNQFHNRSNYMADIVLTIDIYSLKEETTARLAQLIRQALFNNQSTTQQEGLTHLKIGAFTKDIYTSINDRTVHHVSLDIGYKWSGSGA